MLRYWQERRVRNLLLAREASLRAEARRVQAPGTRGEPTEEFREQKRHVLLRNARFALEYVRAAKQARRRARFHPRGTVAPPILDLIDRGDETRSQRHATLKVQPQPPTEPKDR